MDDNWVRQLVQEYEHLKIYSGTSLVQTRTTFVLISESLFQGDNLHKVGT